MVTAIYCLSFRNGKKYVGRATDLSSRISKHKGELKHNKHKNQHMQNTYNKYGDFTHEVLEITTPDKLAEKELHWIEKLDTCNRATGLNIEKPTGEIRCANCHRIKTSGYGVAVTRVASTHKSSVQS